MTAGSFDTPGPPAPAPAAHAAAPPKASTLKARLLMGPVLIASLIGLVWVDEYLSTLAAPAFLRTLGYHHPLLPPGIIVLAVMILVSVLASRELAALLHEKDIECSRRVTTISAILGVLVSSVMPGSWRGPTGAELVATAAVAVLVFALRFYSRNKTTQGVIAATGGAVLAFVYLGLMFGFILALRREHSAWVLLWVLLVIKSCDIGAFFTGKAVGRHKLIVWLSPGKTWEGLFGGITMAALVATAGLFVLRGQGAIAINATDLALALMGIGTGVLFGLAGQGGDLMMSLFKRDAGVKDSGHVVPGMGGILDVIDSPLLVAPIAFWWLRLIQL